jgi:uncharacterized coiled-coil protein SlyX
MENLESRVTDLEIQISYQIRMLEELNLVVISQQKQIKKIEEINRFLIQNLKNPVESEGQIATDYVSQKPPHY